MKFKNSFLALALSAIIFLSGCSGETPVSDFGETEATAAAVESEAEESTGIASQITVPSPETGEPTSETDSQTETVSESTPDTDSETAAADTSENITNSAASEPVVTTNKPTTEKPVVTASKPTTEKPVVTASKPITEKPVVTTNSPITEKPVVTTTSKNENEDIDVPNKKVGFYVNKTGLYDAKGNLFVMRGINHAHTWFKDKLYTAIPAIAATGANTVRIVLSDGQQWTKDSVSDVKNIIELCKSNKLICILEVHDITGKNDIEGLRRTTDYWIEIKDALIGNENYVILNIANEWVGDWNGEIWYKGYSEAVKKLRKAGFNNTIMVDAAGWGQYGESIGKYGKRLLQDDVNGNLMFSVHMYGTAGGSKESIRRNLRYAYDNGLCAVVGEFGYNHSDGDVDEGYIMQYCTENNVGYLGWSWKGNGGGVEYLDIAKDWEGKTLSEDWGEVLINSPNGIKKTSQICSVFEG